SANFRTLSINDIVKDGNIAGLRLNFSDGSNNIGQNKSAIGGVKFKFGDSAYIGALYGYSTKKVSQKYEVGGGKGSIDKKGSLKITNGRSNGISYLEDYDEDDEDVKLFIPYTPEDLKQKPQSHIAKIEYGDDYNTLALQFRNYKTGFIGRKLSQNTYQLNYNLKDPNRDNIDINLIYAQNKGTQDYQKGAKFTSLALNDDLKTINNSKFFDLSNSFKNQIPNGFIETKIGFNILKNSYKKSRHPTEISFIGQKNDDCSGLECYKEGYEANTLYPEGDQKFNSIYIDNSINYSIFTLTSNFNWTKYQYEGERYDRLDKLRYPEGPFEKLYGDDFCINSKFKHIKDKYFESGEDYDYECRPLDNAHYRSFDYGNDRFLNYSFSLSAYVHDMFMPFINHSKTHRAPNIKEMFFSEFGATGVNNNLKPEMAKTWQIGFNSFSDGLFSDDDKFRFKLLAYKTKIRNYIYNKKQRKKDETREPFYIKHNNYHKDVKIKGLELELGYDIGIAYMNLAYARQNTDQPLNFTDASPNVNSVSNRGKWFQGYGLTKLTMLPKDYASIDIGTRMFDKKLTIGAKAKYYGKSKITTLKIESVACPGVSKKLHSHGHGNDSCGYIKKDGDLESQGFIFDFYTIYKPTENFIIKAEIQNIFDKAYINPLDANNDSASQFYFEMGVSDDYQYLTSNYARGRTALVSFSYEF
ncbi:TonB-dependent receptor domain-containing protein, partial [Campylobacter portucalensis]|uniref:TonB-dependent receptor domain-containing protein n=1 Tax=Campylobacter portucalensis TaxID=2608384 RepID=UPI0018A6C2A1